MGLTLLLLCERTLNGRLRQPQKNMFQVEQLKSVCIGLISTTMIRDEKQEKNLTFNNTMEIVYILGGHNL